MCCNYIYGPIQLSKRKSNKYATETTKNCCQKQNKDSSENEFENA